MKIALIELINKGHNETYVRLFSKALLELGHEVTVFYPEPEMILHWINENTIESKKIKTFKIKKKDLNSFLNKFPPTIRTMAYWSKIILLIKHYEKKNNIKFDLIFFSWLEILTKFSTIFPIRKFILPLLSKVFNYKWTGLLHSGLTEPFTDFINCSNCISLTTLNEYFVEKEQNKISKPIIFLPDIIDSSHPENSSLTREIKLRAGTRKIITLAGGLQKRKGVMTLLRASQKMNKDNYFFIFAGELYKNSFNEAEVKEIRNYLNLKPDNCYFFLKRIESEKYFNEIINLSHIIFAAYIDFYHSSNLITKAAFFNKPIIVSEGFCMEKRIKEYKLGIAIEQENVEQLIEAIKKIELFNFDGNLLNKFLKTFHFEGFKEAISITLKQ